MMPYFLYILESEKNGSYYVGTTNNLEDRINRHNEGRVKYTQPKRPWKLIYSEAHPDRSNAMKREYEIKSHKRKGYIENLIKEFSGG